MLERIAGFEWDAGNRGKCTRHGLTVAEIESVFDATIAMHPDRVHSIRETRYLGIGRTAAGRHVFVAFTLRGRDGERWIRPISARYMHAKEIRHFEKEVARPQN